MPNLLILSYFFPPSNDIASRRFGTMAAHLDQAGFNVSVLTTHSQGSLPMDLPEENVLRIGSNRQKTASVDDLAAEKLPLLINTLRQPARKRGFYMWSVDRTVTTWYRKIKEQLPNIETRIPKPDLIIGSFGPSASLWGARFLADYYQVPWIADIRDLGAQRYDDRNFMARLTDLTIEKMVLESAAGLTTVSDTLKEILASRYPQPIEVIYNGWDRALLSKVTRENPRDHNYLYYAGSFHPEQRPALQLLLEALADYPDLALMIRSLGPEDVNLWIRSQAARLGISGHIILLPPSDHEVVSREARQAIACLVFNDMSTENEWTKGTITGKLFELLVHPAPILAVGRPDGEMGVILRQTGKGELCSSKGEIRGFFNRLQKEPDAYHGVNDKITAFSRQQQAIRLAGFIRRFLPVAATYHESRG